MIWSSISSPCHTRLARRPRWPRGAASRGNQACSSGSGSSASPPPRRSAISRDGEWRRRQTRRPFTSVRRVTDFPGLEEFPSISPDRRSVAFTANVNGRRQIFVRLLTSGPPLQITKNPVDHQLPRWSPDASSLVYFSPADPGDAQGTIWSIPALGGSPRRVMASIGGADVSRSGRVTCFSLVDGQHSTADVRARRLRRARNRTIRCRLSPVSALVS